MKLNSNRKSAYSLLLALLFAKLLFSSCGTEVGNGLKTKPNPQGGEDPENKSEASEEKIAQDSKPLPRDVDEAAEEMGSVSEGNIPDAAINTDILFNKCGSPFSEAYSEPIELKKNSTTINGTLEEGTWSISENEEFVAYAKPIENEDAFDIQILNDNLEVEEETYYECSNKTSETLTVDDTKYIKRTVTVRDIDSDNSGVESTKLEWVIELDASEAPKSLTKIIISNEQQDDIVFNRAVNE